MWSIRLKIAIIHILSAILANQGVCDVIRKSGTEDYITLGSVFHTATTNSRSECASLCASTSGCRSSMLIGHTCNLYTRSNCTCPGEVINPSLSSYYMLFKQPTGINPRAYEDAVAQCEQYGMHLVAINSAEEQKAIEELVAAQAADCLVCYTSGWSPVPGSLIMSDWRWRMKAYYTEPLSYDNWATSQPDNDKNKGQDVIALIRNLNYTWADVAHAIENDNKQFCLVCECTE